MPETHHYNTTLDNSVTFGTSSIYEKMSTPRHTSSSTSTTTTMLTTTTTTTRITPPSTSTTTQVATRPAPDIRHTSYSEADTTPYDVVQVFSGGIGGNHDTEDDHSNMMYPEHTPPPIDRMPMPMPPVPHEPEHLPPYYPAIPPPPPYGNNNYRPKSKGGRINSIEEERTAMIIGIVAGILIAVILVILLVLWLKSNGDRAYKTEHEKATAYGSHNPNAALLGNSSSNSFYQQRQSQSGHMPQQQQPQQQQQQQHHHQQQQQQSGMINGSNMMSSSGGYGGMMGSQSSMDTRPQMAGLVQPKPKKRDSKDVKEWYV